jgi:hypothetical protein
LDKADTTMAGRGQLVLYSYDSGHDQAGAYDLTLKVGGVWMDSVLLEYG